MLAVSGRSDKNSLNSSLNPLKCSLVSHSQVCKCLGQGKLCSQLLSSEFLLKQVYASIAIQDLFYQNLRDRKVD